MMTVVRVGVASAFNLAAGVCLVVPAVCAARPSVRTDLVTGTSTA